MFHPVCFGMLDVTLPVGLESLIWNGARAEVEVEVEVEGVRDLDIGWNEPILASVEGSAIWGLLACSVRCRPSVVET